jgi:hypothetical protein
MRSVAVSSRNILFEPIWPNMFSGVRRSATKYAVFLPNQHSPPQSLQACNHTSKVRVESGILILFKRSAGCRTVRSPRSCALRGNAA